MRQLTLGLLLILAPFPATAQHGLRATKHDAEVLNYRLSMEKLHRLVDVQRALNAFNAKHPKVLENIDRETLAAAQKRGEPLTVSQKVSILERYPEIKQAFASGGWSAREWLLTSEAMGLAYTGLEVKNGRLSPDAAPPSTPVQAANVSLLERNQTDFEKILEELNRLGDELIQ